MDDIVSQSKKQKAWKSSSDDHVLESVCVVLSMKGDCCIFLVNDLLNDSGGGGVEGDSCKEIEPNFRFRIGGEPLIFGGVVDGKLIVFYMIDDDKAAGTTVPEAYSYSIELDHKPNNITLHKTDLEKCTNILSFTSKLLPRALRLPHAILLFSTRIKFYNDRNARIFFPWYRDGVIDFEFYNSSIHLPQLHVYLSPPSFEGRPYFRLFDGEKFQEFYGSDDNDSTYRVDFHIVSYGVDEDIFMIETDFGCIFSLNLVNPVQGWKLCDEGRHFLSFNENIVTPDGVCFNAYAAGDHRRRWLATHSGAGDAAGKEQIVKDDKDAAAATPSSQYGSHAAASLQSEYGDGRCVPLPVTSIDDIPLECGHGHFSSSIKLLEKGSPRDVCTPCVVQIAFDPNTILSDMCDPSRLYFFLDVLKVNLKEFPGDEKEEDEYKTFAERITSFKFQVKREYVFSASVVALFPY